jgi:hypothetical protein
MSPLTKFHGEGEENPSVKGHYLVSSLSMLLQEEPVNMDQRDRSTSAGGASCAALGRPRLLSATLGWQLPEDTSSTEGTGLRPRLTVLPGGAQSDVELMRRFRAGDWGGFEALYGRYFTTAYLVCRRILTCSETALDSANDTFLAMLANSDHLDPHRVGDWLVDTAHYLGEFRVQQGLPLNNRPWLHLVQCYPLHDRGAGEQL